MSEHLLDILCSGIRMLATRGYIYDNFKYLEGDDINGSYIDAVYGTDAGVEKRPQKEIAYEIKKRLGKMAKFGNSTSLERTRLMMSDYFLRKIPKKNPNDPTEPQTYESCLLFFSAHTSTTSQTPVSEVKLFMEILEHFKMNSGIFISPTNLSSDANNSLFVYKHGFDIQHFTDKELLFDPSAHIWNGYARIISKEEREALAKEENLNNLERIYTNEPYAKYLGAHHGDVIVIRNQIFIPETLASIETTYRYVKRPTEKKKKK